MGRQAAHSSNRRMIYELSAKVRGRLLVDLLQGLQLRAKGWVLLASNCCKTLEAMCP